MRGRRWAHVRGGRPKCGRTRSRPAAALLLMSAGGESQTGRSERCRGRRRLMYMARGATLASTHSPLHVHLLALTTVYNAHDIRNDDRSFDLRNRTTCRAQATFQTRSVAASRMASAWSRSGCTVNGERAVLLCALHCDGRGIVPKKMESPQMLLGEQSGRYCWDSLVISRHDLA